ncbi:MAG: LysR family transcriptional regulator [Oscillospiraceae bacterium]|nr:LysR family transcriptional regulator [Oscillospiraceae bacterium]
MTNQQIEYVMAVAEERSFSKAAKKLFVTQPSLSKFIINLETQLGIALFDRSSSPITITEAGSIFIETANRMKELEQDMFNKMSDLAGLKNGSLRIGASPFRASSLLSQSVVAFHSRYPDIQILISENQITELEQELLKGELDIAIGMSKFDTELFGVEDLALEKLYLAVPEKLPINKKLAAYKLNADDIKFNSEKLFSLEHADLREFRKEDFIFQNNSDYNSQSILKICKNAGFNPKITFTSRSLETIFSFVTSGLGIAFIPDTFIRYSNKSEHPVYYAVSDILAENQIKLIYKKNKYLSKAAQQFCITLKELISMGTWK